LETALAIDPGMSQAKLLLLGLDERAGATESMRARAETLLEDPSTPFRAVRAILSTYVREHDTSGGLACVESLEKRFPKDTSIAISAAVFRVGTGVPPRGVAALPRIAEEDPDSPGAFAVLASAEESSADSL